VAVGLLVGLVTATAAVNVPPPVPQPDQVVIVANRAVPASVSLARYYAEKRGVPFRNICLLDLPRKERISRHEYETLLRDPLLRFLRKRELVVQHMAPAEEIREHDSGWRTDEVRFRYLVSMYGVPLAIEETSAWRRLHSGDGFFSRTGAAVDSELCLLLREPYDPAGAVNSPLFNHLFFPDGPGAQFFIEAVRLDGPDEETVRRMIDDSREAEEYGLQGICCFDLKASREKGYALGDYWLEESAERWARAGYEVIRETTPAEWGRAVPLEDVAVYFGWYRRDICGPFARRDFRFRTGAIAVHIHSSSAVTLRSRTRYWAGPLLARGVVATIGAVDEPYLPTMPWLNVLSDRLCRGYCWADATYMALPVVSWQITVIGDPLYRPFGRDLAGQMKRLRRTGRDDSFACVRKVNLLVRGGMLNPALDFCRSRLRKADSLVVREKLADLYALNGLVEQAAAEYRQVIARAVTPETAVRCTVKLLGLPGAALNEKQSRDLLERVRARWAGAEVLEWLERKAP